MYDYISCYVMRLDPPPRLVSNKGMLTLDVDLRKVVPFGG